MPVAIHGFALMVGPVRQLLLVKDAWLRVVEAVA
jgi:hypothetical protein